MQRLLAHPAVIKAKTILMYHSLPDEVDTKEAIIRLASEGKTVLLPKVTGEGTMEIRIYEGPSGMAEGAFGIMEPTGRPVRDYGKTDVAVIPGMAFDAKGNRLGRGKGFYDRLLAKMQNTYKIGICFSFQKTDAVPVNENDARMDEIITSD